MRFVTLIRFTGQGVGQIRQTTQRAQQFRDWAASVGITIQELLWTQGSCDGVVLFEAPDVESASAAMLGLASKGNVQTETMPAFDAQGMQQVLSKL